ncbi:dihydropteroate synthase [Acididesulfobacillus acetoxydans]|uniref:Dihydropteroate synthase n=1 Tax=Acididesulfobacillus acetoxydans TaxID=1561005 RepID=A0A8S0Y1S9_9FIRM|nr:dihydropteroate synthase [Acididesulfobacillus acetoxydans]CAA7599915.1 dihydropteroate synthase [Acididesulfobacillus acetoxydans]CEJ06871.1 Dihydropteroate synthase [Acididesulfobacillus acetoxydans]
MKDYGMRWVEMENLAEARNALSWIGSDQRGIAVMAGKSLARAIKLEKVPLRAAHVLKQEMLAAGGDAAVHRNVIVNKVEQTDVLLLGTFRQLGHVAQKLAVQPFGLKDVGEALKRLLVLSEPPKERSLDCRGLTLPLGKRTLVMGILNVTPDSFSDGGRFAGVEAAVRQAERLAEEGADILDIGGESTRPGHREVSPEEEWARLEPVLKVLVREMSIPLSVDTWKAEVAGRAMEAGAHMINDQWGLQRDPEMARVAGRYQAPVVVMHNRTGTDYRHMMGDILEFLRRSCALAAEQGLAEDQVIVDPGIGFGKTTEQNLEVMARLGELKALGHPILLGASRKSMIGNTLKVPVDERLEGTLAASVVGVAAGADIIRVHDVQANRRAITLADAIYRGQRGVHYGGA